MLEKKLYYISLKTKEIKKTQNLTEAQYEISATKIEVERLKKYLDRCLDYEKNEGRSMINPLSLHESKEANQQYKEDLNTILNMIYDLGTQETKSDFAAI